MVGPIIEKILWLSNTFNVLDTIMSSTLKVFDSHVCITAPLALLVL